uniref:NADH dehydrogenase subunit 6 n=1 Tax=Nuttallia olivacea TaxID=1125678 RepID=I6NJC1_9BIVA|nr:NADH dehydrogenase subunit 6 [Nuttallia olivacea]AEV94299.1 NADH dehydrogenase subunit 6 [Nuttallia olivacea]
MVVVFWGCYSMVLVSLLMCSVTHPLSMGASILILYTISSVVVCFGASFVVGVFLFLTGVSGMLVAFLYAVALCPNPVFTTKVYDVYPQDKYFNVNWWQVLVMIFPLVVGLFSYMRSFYLEGGYMSHKYQWMRDPEMGGGLTELMPFMGVLLFLCVVMVAFMCSHQKQCLGGHKKGAVGTKRSYD